MGILSEFDFDNLPEASAVPAGEYEVVILAAENYLSEKSGKSSIKVTLDIPAEVNADVIYNYLGMPMPQDDEKAKAKKLRRIKQFIEAFGISKDADFPEWVGKMCWALVGQETDQNGELRNTIKKFLQPSSGTTTVGIDSSKNLDDVPF